MDSIQAKSKQDIEKAKEEAKVAEAKLTDSLTAQKKALDELQ